MVGNDGLYSYAGTILRINLSNGEIRKESTSRYAREWVGSTGIAIKILYDELRSWVTPYDPANKIVFGTGVLQGTPAPGACKMSVSTLGPRTGGWASGLCDSYVGGEIKCAGYDLIILEGRAHKPVYLRIQDDAIELRDAEHLWGHNTWETLETIRKELQDPTLHILSIGPAGENLVRGACIVQDKARAFGRCGAGAVMGSKNLKAIVAKGTKAIKVADRERFMAVVHKVRDMFKTSPAVEEFRHYGTLKLLKQKNAMCGVNYKNFQEVYFPEAMAEAIEPKQSLDKYRVAKQNFPGCPIGCGTHLHITEGPYAGLVTEANQWEVVPTLQGRLAIEEPTFMFKVNALCNQLGLDIDAAGGPIGWAMECYQRGILTEKDTGGYPLVWGDAELALELVRKIAYREGFGDLLAEGAARAADLLGRGSGYYAMHLKGQDLYESCRGNLAWSLGTTTSTRGGGHTTGAIETLPGINATKMRTIYGVDNAEKVWEYEGKAKMTVYMEAVHRINNSLGVCHFNTIWGNLDLIDLPQLAELYSTATGWPTSVDDMKRLAERQLNLEKAFNLRFTAFDRKDDLPTPRDLAEAIPTGPAAGWKFDLKKYNGMLDEYYDLHGWDRKTSFPTRATLVGLGLESVADNLEKIGKLGKP
ncbi:MAG: aldehyde ferredoxin oxidoreductase family protein [Syntrophales bacterium]|nr:aldehyde ferredoxin oxidoreductase family protein [Syntrophales bacterium]